MSIRVKLLLLGVGMVVVAMLAMGVFMANKQERLYKQEMENKAQVLLEGFSAVCVSAMASDEFEKLDRLVEELHFRLEETADLESVMILNHRREVVGHTNKEMYGRHIDDPFVKEACESAGATIRYVQGEPSRTMVVAMPLDTRIGDLPGIHWGTVIASFDLSRADAEVAGLLTNNLVAVLAFAIITALLFSLAMQRSLIRPILQLTAAALQLKEGDLSARSNVVGSGELSQLSSTLDGMAAGLQRYTGQLHELVAQRTQGLNQANEELREAMRKVEEANERLEELATTDALTRLRNRRHLQEMLEWHFPLAQRSRRDLAFIMIDVDHFKNYNDTHGHPAGDTVLVKFAELLKGRVRRTDVACRYGGEEFAVMLPDTGPLDAKRLGEEIRRIVEESVFPNEETQPGGRLTVSVGVGCASSDMVDPGQLVEKADRALYRAKNDGRNRTVLLS